jgi:hypothetical protein
VNTAIAAAYESSQRPTVVHFYNSTISKKNPITYETLMNLFLELRHESPLHEKLFWYPYYSIKSNIFFFTLTVVVNLLIPAFIFDIFCFLCNKKVL